MIGIDTNVLIRYLTLDDEVQSKKATNLINKYIGIDKSIFINTIVICEIICVLDRGYKYSKSQIIHVLKEIIATSEFHFENHNILWLAVTEYEKSSADFSDILISYINKLYSCSTSYTFDTKASSSSNFTSID